MPMTSDDLARRIQASIAKNMGGEDPNSVSAKPLSGLNMDITPNKPDPEAVANSRINAAANGPANAPVVVPPSSNSLSPQEMALLRQHFNNVLTPRQIPNQMGQLQAPQQQQLREKPMPNDDIQSQDIKQQYYKKLSGQDDDQDEDK